MEKEVKLNSEYIFDGKVVHLYKDEVLCPNGRKSVREVIRHQGASCVIAIHDGKIIMEKQYRYPFDCDMIEIPAGKIDQGEEPKEGALRELEEETGYRANKITYLGKILPTVAYSDEVIHLFLAEDLIKTSTHWDPDENIEIFESSLEELVEMIEKGEIIDSKTVIAILRYKLILEKRK